MAGIEVVIIIAFVLLYVFPVLDFIAVALTESRGEKSPDDTSVKRCSKNPYADLIGLTTVSYTSLKPSGYVLIDNNRVPARTEGAFLDVNQAVEIVGADANAVVVRKKM
ncbi:MAG: hypothetical protein FJ220_04540 [Kiritimatiellaceae bacterium]|nr:hypothetical protein [Kiritimatiellaceae bacterium]